MTNLVELIKSLRHWCFTTRRKPANNDYNFNDTITTSGKKIDVKKELGGQVPCCVEIYCAQNFTVQYGYRSVADKTWPRTLIAGAWHKWSNRGWETINVVPAVAASTQIVISAVEPKG